MNSVVLSLLLLALSRTAVAAPGDLKEMKPEEYVPPPNRVDRDNVDEDSARNLRGLQTCFNFRWELWTPEGCNFNALVRLMNREQASWGCNHDSVTELMRIFGCNTRSQVERQVNRMCLEAFGDKEERDGVTFGEILMQDNSVFGKAYFDGGTYLNEARETKDATGLRMDHNWAMPRSRINSAYYGAARYNTRIIFPEAETAEDMTNFDNCETRAAMCCWTQDRQANDDNGNCEEPYDEDCVDADPADNTDVCYVDLQRSPQSNRVENGLTVFDGEQEGDVHCHGFAWSNNANEPSALFKGANLFYVSMYDHLGQRGYVRNVPGAPMCGCVEQMPTVSRSDCTEIEFIKQWTGYTFQPGIGLSAYITYTEVDFNACQGANNNNNDLSAYYQRLVNEGRASGNEYNRFKQYVVGDNQCPAAINNFMRAKGWRRA